MKIARPSGRNIRIEIEYDGANYAGWQAQRRPGGRKSEAGGAAEKRTIQEVIEKILHKILGENVKLTASGRTDAGVHALGQVANFSTRSKLPAGNLLQALNALLPADIAVIKVHEVPPEFHSRFSAKSKTYRYIILNRPYPSALARGRAYHLKYPLDVELMLNEARGLSGSHDFSAFCSSSSAVKDKTRGIKNISLKKKKGGFIELEIEADGFLYNMARSIAGTLIEIGRERFKKGDVKKILRSRDRKLAGPTAPAHGLYLVRVKY